MVFLFISVMLLLALLFGSVGYLICYMRQEKKRKIEEKKKQKYNGYNGWYAYW